MANSIFSFLYSSLRKQANNPDSSQWLPLQLEKLGLPLHRDAPSTTVLKEDSAAVSQSIQSIVLAQWQLLLEADLGSKSEILDEFEYVTYPQKPYPELTVKNMIINGLQNIELLEPSDIVSGPDGYRVVATARGPAYDTLPRLNLTGEFSMELTVCATDKDDLSKPTKRPLPLRWMKWPVETISWYGSFSIDVTTDTYADTDLQIGVRGTGKNRRPALTVEKNVIRDISGQGIPTLLLDPDKLVVETSFSGIGDILKEQTKTAFAYHDTQQYLVDSINAAVTTASLRDRMSDEVTGFITQTLDKQLGAVPAGRLPSPEGQHAANAADQYLFDRVRFALTDKDGAFYLPDVLKNSQHPVMEPYAIASIFLGNYTFQGLVFEDTTLDTVTIAGLSGLQLDSDHLVFEKDATISAEIALDLRINGNFAFLMAGAGRTEGTLDIALKSRATCVQARFRGENAENLVVTFREISLSSQPGDLSITVNMQSIFLDIINRFFNGDGMKNQLIAELNKKISAEKEALSASVTKKLRELIKSKLER